MVVVKKFCQHMHQKPMSNPPLRNHRRLAGKLTPLTTENVESSPQIMQYFKKTLYSLQKILTVQNNQLSLSLPSLLPLLDLISFSFLPMDFLISLHFPPRLTSALSNLFYANLNNCSLYIGSCCLFIW